LPDITIRHAHLDDCPALAQVLIKATQHAFRGRVPDHCLEWITPEESAVNWAKNFNTEQTLKNGSYLFVAETRSDGIVGFAMLGEVAASTHYFGQDSYEDYFHELRSLQIHPTWQRQGIGRRLISRVAEQVDQEGGTHLLVRMLRENPNMGYYEHLGAVHVGTNPFIWEGYHTDEIVFGWENVERLCNL